MAGHSKWANIQHRKKAQDNKRGKLFTKLIREITVAAKEGGGDLDSNPRLRLAVDKALGGNMTRDTIERAIKRGSGGDDDGNYDEVRYEGYGSGGIAVIVDCLTDNRNRTVGEVRHAFSKMGGNLGADGSVAYMFQRTGVLSYADDVDEDGLMDAALEAGADDVVSNEDGSTDVLTTRENFSDIKDALVAAGFAPAHAEVTMRPDNLTEVDVSTARTVMKMIDMLEDLDDVQEVYSNADFPAEALEG